MQLSKICSAVSESFVTAINEGANKGILVTTSNLGRHARDFVKDKPLTLMNGANLLHLLEKHGYQMRIDLRAARELLRQSSCYRQDTHERPY